MDDILIIQDMVVLNRGDRFRMRHDDSFMDNLSDQEFLKQFRFSKEAVIRLTDIVEHQLTPANDLSHRVTPLHQVELCDNIFLQLYFANICEQDKKFTALCAPT